MFTSAPKRRKPAVRPVANRTRQTREFVPHALRADWLVARFGRTSVTIKPNTEPRKIYRGEPRTDDKGERIPAGEWPGFGYTVEIEGEMTCTVATLDAAKAMGEWRALNSETNHRRASGNLLYSLTPGRAAEVMKMLDDDRDALMAAYPFSEEEKAQSVRNFPNFAEGAARNRAREVERLCGFLSPFA